MNDRNCLADCSRYFRVSARLSLFGGRLRFESKGATAKRSWWTNDIKDGKSLNADGIKDIGSCSYDSTTADG